MYMTLPATGVWMLKKCLTVKRLSFSVPTSTGISTAMHSYFNYVLEWKLKYETRVFLSTLLYVGNLGAYTF
jgi:hypothetical protein